MQLDINEKMGESGVGGRMLDVSRNNGFKPYANTVDKQAILANGSPDIIKERSSYSLRLFNKYPTSQTMNNAIRKINGIAA